MKTTTVPVAWADRTYIRKAAARNGVVFASVVVICLGMIWAFHAGHLTATPRVLAQILVIIPLMGFLGWVALSYLLDLLRIQPLLRIENGKLAHASALKLNIAVSRIESISIREMRSGRKIRIQTKDGRETLLGVEQFEQAAWMREDGCEFDLSAFR